MALVLTEKSKAILDNFFKNNKTDFKLSQGKLTISHDGFTIVSEAFPKFLEPTVFNQLNQIYKDAATKFKDLTFGLTLDKGTGQVQAIFAAKEDGNLIQIDNGDLSYDPKSLFNQQVLDSIVKAVSGIAPEASDFKYEEGQGITAITTINDGQISSLKSVKVGNNRPMSFNIGELITDKALDGVAENILARISSQVLDQGFLFNHESFKFGNSGIQIDFMLSQSPSQFEGADVPSIVINDYKQFPADLSMIGTTLPEGISEDTQQAVEQSGQEMQNMITSYTPEGAEEYKHKKNLKPNLTPVSDWEAHHTVEGSFTTAKEALHEKLIELESSRSFTVYGIDLSVFKPAQATDNKELFPTACSMIGAFKPSAGSDISSYIDSNAPRSAEVPLSSINVQVQLSVKDSIKIGNGSNGEIALSESTDSIVTFTPDEGLKSSSEIADLIMGAEVSTEKMGPSRDLQKNWTSSHTPEQVD